MWVVGVEEGGASVRTTQMTRQSFLYFWGFSLLCSAEPWLTFANALWSFFFAQTFSGFLSFFCICWFDFHVNFKCQSWIDMWVFASALFLFRFCSYNNNKKLSKTKPITRHAHTQAWGQVPSVFMTFMLIMLTPKCLSPCESIVLTAQCGLECRSSLATGLRRVCVIFGIPLYF